MQAIAHDRQDALDGHRASVLIVDDDPATRALLRAVVEDLVALPCHIYEAEDGGSALRIAHQVRPRLVLLDIVLPGSDASGVLICQQLCKDANTKVIIITGVSSRSIVDACLSAGAAECILKPFSTDHMRTAIERCLSLATLVSASAGD
jgi:CheY-like chemotaxis protein